MFVFLLLCIVAACYGQSPFTGRSSVSLTSRLFFNLTAKAFRLGKDIDFAKDVVWKMSDMQLILPHVSTFGSTVYDKEAVFWKDPNPACQRQVWATTGQADTFMELTSVNKTLLKYSGYADLISHVDLEKPFLRFKAEAFLSDSSRSDCTYMAGMDTAYEMKTYDNEELCYSQGRECNVWIGSSGWLYLGGAGTASDYQYGFQLFPHWSFTGTRVELTLDAGQYINIADPAFSANAPAPTYGSFPYWEMGELTTNPGAMIRFYADDGILQSGLSLYSMELAAGTIILFDLWDLKEDDANYYNAATCELDIEFKDFIKADFSLTGDDAANLKMLIYYGPDDWFLKTYTFTHDATADTVSVKFTLHKRVPGVKPQCNGVTMATVAETTEAPTVAPTQLAPTPAPIPCPPLTGQTCNGHGACVVGQCMCADGWTSDIVEGCKNNAEATKVETTMVGATTPAKVTVKEASVVQTTVATFTVAEETDPKPITRPETEGKVVTQPPNNKTPAAQVPGPATGAGTLSMAAGALLAMLLARL